MRPRLATARQPSRQAPVGGLELRRRQLALAEPVAVQAAARPDDEVRAQPLEPAQARVLADRVEVDPEHLAGHDRVVGRLGPLARQRRGEHLATDTAVVGHPRGEEADLPGCQVVGRLPPPPGEAQPPVAQPCGAGHLHHPSLAGVQQPGIEGGLAVGAELDGALTPVAAHHHDARLPGHAASLSDRSAWLGAAGRRSSLRSARHSGSALRAR